MEAVPTTLASVDCGTHGEPEVNSRFGVAEAVYEYLNARRGLPVTLTELSKELGYTRAQISGAIAHIRNGWRLTIETPRRGVYVLTGSRVEQHQAEQQHAVVPFQAQAEVIALVADGRLLVNVEGVVYVATPLDIE